MAREFFRIAGTVQGVGFRAAAAEKANEIGLVGWTQNTLDGHVEVLATGEQEQLDALSDWLHTGPPGSEVEHVERHVREDETIMGGGFVVR